MATSQVEQENQIRIEIEILLSRWCACVCECEIYESVCVCVCERDSWSASTFFFIFIIIFSFFIPSLLKFSWLLLLKLDNNFAYDTTISGIRRGWVFTLETVIVAEGHVLLWRQHLVLFHVLHVVGVRQAAYVVIWWICKLVKKKIKGKIVEISFQGFFLHRMCDSCANN